MLVQLTLAEQLRERASYTRLAMAVVNELFALKLRALAEACEDKAGRPDERQNR